MLAAFAQEESRSLSENVKWGKRKRLYEDKGILMPLYGYQKDETADNYEMVLEEAEVLKRIFDMYEHGISVPKIADWLLENDINPPRYGNTGTDRWDEGRIHYMIKNERYVGDKLLQKRAPKSFLTKQPDKNVDFESNYLVDDHEAIIERETWEAVQKMLKMRREELDSETVCYHGRRTLSSMGKCSVRTVEP